MSELRENKYTASSLKILQGLEPVKKRPGMYIGSTDWRGTHHLVWETIDNAIDEALSGWGKKIYINIYKDGSISVQDEGRGIPCDYNEEENSILHLISLLLVYMELVLPVSTLYLNG